MLYDKKRQEIMTRNKRSSDCILQIIITSKLQIQCEKGVHFSFDFGWYSIHLDFAC